MKQVNQHIGNRIRNFRKMKKLTIQQLADMIHKSRATVSKYDRWVLDVRHEGFTVRVFLQPDEELAKKLKSYAQQ